MITKKDLKHLAELARIDFSAGGGSFSGGRAGEEKKLIKDLSNILDYFKELQDLNTDKVEPMTGGTDLRNILREDILEKENETGKGKEAFPEEEGDYLKVPPVF